jgi:tripartite-type tricarboxylate transporter receptor subunit TctC
MEAFRHGLGLDILHVPYKGTGQSVPALVGGQVHMAVAAYNSIAGFAKEGRIKVIAGNTRERMAMLAQFPPMGDAGLKDFHFPGENALFVPSGTPKPVIDKLAAAVAKVLAMPDIVTKLNTVGVEPPPAAGPCGPGRNHPARHPALRGRGPQRRDPAGITPVFTVKPLFSESSICNRSQI